MSIFNIKRLVVAVIFTATVVFLTHLPQEVMLSRLQVSGLDKLQHFLAYGAMTLLFILSFKTSFTMLSALVLFFAISSVATLDELTQPFVNRVASPIDWLADIVGIIIALLAFVYFNRSKRQAVTNTDS